MREAARFASGAPWQGVRTLVVVCALLLLHARATEAIGRSGAFTNQLLEEADNLVDQLQLPEVTSADELTALNSVEPSALSEQPARSEPAADFRFRAVSSASASATEAESAALPADVLQLEEVNHRIMSELQATANENEDDLPPLPQSEHEAEPVEDNVLEELIAHHGAAAAPADQHNTHATPEMRFRSQRAQDCGCSACPCQQPKPVCGCTVCPCRRRVVKKNPVLRSKIKQLEQQIAKMTQDRTESGRVLEQEKRELKSIMDQIKNTPTTTSTTRAPSTPPPSSTAPITPEQQQQQVTQELLQQVTKQLRDVKAEVQKREELVQRASKRTEQKITEESTAIDESTEQTEKLQVEESQLEQLLINLQERLTKNNQVVQQQTAQLKQQQALVEQRTQQMQETVQQISTIEREEVSALKIINIITRTEEAVRNQTTSLRVTPPPSLKPGTLPPVSLPPVNITMPPISTPSPPRVNTLPPTAQAQQVLVAQQQVTQQQITQQQLTQQQVTQQQVTQQQVTQQQIPQQQTPGAVPLPPAPPGGVLPPTQQQQAQPQPQVPKQQQRRPGERNVHQHAFFGGLTAAEAAGGLKTTVEDQAVDAIKTQVQSTAK